MSKAAWLTLSTFPDDDLPAALANAVHQAIPLIAGTQAPDITMLDAYGRYRLAQIYENRRKYFNAHGVVIHAGHDGELMALLACFIENFPIEGTDAKTTKRVWFSYITTTCREAEWAPEPSTTEEEDYART